MSVQLIVYPQSYEGEYNSITTTANEFIVDGTNFNTLNTSSSYDAPSLLQTAIDNQPPSVVNTWYRYRTTGSGTPTLPTEVSGNLTLYSVSSSSLCGVYQKLSNLVVGTTYEIVIDVSTTGAGFIVPSIYDGSTFVAATIFSAGSSQVTYSFTATSVNQIVVISYSNTTADNIVISNISVSQQGVTPTTIFTDLQDGQVICDLYEDEDLPLTLSVDNFKNVAEKVQSYSKAFNLPATKRNNQIFDNIFEITRTDTGLNFNPYKRTKAILKQDGFLLFEGYLRLLDITDKEGEISYNVNLYSEVIALADTLKDRAFRDLDFTELEHDYNKTQIKASWNDGVTAGQNTPITWNNSGTSGFRTNFETLKYPFVDWDHQIIVADNPGGGSGPIDGNPQYTALEQIFRPFINIKYLIDRIFEASEFTYESAFFSTTDFKKLYMDFNWGADNSPVNIESTKEAITDGSTIAGNFPSYNTLSQNSNNFNSDFGYSAGVYTAQYNNQTFSINYAFTLRINNTTIQQLFNGEARWKLVKSGITTFINIQQFSGIVPASSVTDAGYIGNILETLNIGDTLTPEFTNDTSFGSVLFTSEPTYTTGQAVPSVVNISSPIITTNIILQTLRGELGQWDFLKGIITMFNLITMPDEDNPNNIKIEPYKDIFLSSNDILNPNFYDLNSVPLNWTDKIDISEMKLTPLTDLNRKNVFKFVEDDDDYSFNQYKNLVGGHLYGSKKYNAGNEFNILDGEEEIIAEPFAATVVKPLMSQFPNFITPAIYANGGDGVWEGFENSPRIMYNNGIKPTGASYYIPAQNGLSSENQTYFLQFSHIKVGGLVISDYADFHFGECQLLTNQASTLNNLFNLYWLPYYNELYNPNTRTMTIKVNLSPADINTFKFNDTVFIKNRVFRVNKIDYKPNDLATVEFILIP